jgi:hypothetical protein
MARKPEVHEPLPEHAAGHLLQDRDAPFVVLDEVVVGREDACDATLGVEGWNWKALRQQLVDAQVVLGGASRDVSEPLLPVVDGILDEADIRSMGVW